MKAESSINQAVDITPTPRILRTLGDIPFTVWQCLAELMDNSLDGFSNAEAKGLVIEAPRIDIHWSSESVPIKEREIVVEDNGLGMELEVLRKAAKAGYSSNDPIHNLGLFGMGFNIATARLGIDNLIIDKAISDSNFDIMHDNERNGTSFIKGCKGNIGNIIPKRIEEFRVRYGVGGGYHDELSESDLEYITSESLIIN